MSRPPQRAEVYKKQLTGIEQAVILAMLEIGDDTGECLYPSVPRIAAWSKFDERSVQRAIWGDHRKHPGRPKPKREKGQPDKECPFCPNCLISRRVLQQLAPANWKERRTARYRLNLEILDDCEIVRSYLYQKKLNFPPTEKRPTVASPSDPRSLPQRPTVASPSDPRSHDSKAFDSITTDSKAGGFKSSPPSFSNPDPLDLLRSAAKDLCERTAFPDTHSNVAVVAAAIKAIQRQHGDTPREAAETLERCVRFVQSKNYPDLRIDRFFFEDAKYNSGGLLDSLSLRLQPSPEPPPVVCKTCAGEGWLHLQPHHPSVNGKRIIPCADCNPDGKQWGDAA